ncbi:Protein prune-like protein [Morus notabilis]|uniref:Protein prune-like protein n=1 Tax=Morus notabilis TaxID=981085 RepID=W9RW59_9ROSA|nr:Protein prune-like protein [Morus notabilis]
MPSHDHLLINLGLFRGLFSVNSCNIFLSLLSWVLQELLLRRITRREDPIYKDLLIKHDDHHQAFTFDTGHEKHVSYTSENELMEESQSELDSETDFVFDPFKESSSERSLKVDKTASFDSTNELGYKTLLDDWSTSTIDKTYVVNKRKVDLASIPLPQSAASFYSGISPQMEVVELCESTKRLNLYLKARRDEVNAGGPGRFLHAVIGQDVSDVGSIASTIMYAFYLNETQKTDQFCTVPVINMKRADLNAHAELQWLLDSCQIDQSSLIFVDEVDLSYYDLFGSLKLVLLNGHKLPAKQEGESEYPWVEIFTETEDCSCCTFVAEKFALTSPEILVGKGFSRLLLAGILLDSGNLTNAHCSSKDKYMATLLIHGAGRLGCTGLYQILRYKKHDISDLKVIDILRKDFKRWTRVGKPDGAGSRLTVSHIGMSSIGISVSQLLSRVDTATQEITYFQQLEKLRLLMVVSGYYDSKNNFKREILVSAESAELMKNLLSFFNSNATHLTLKVLHRPGLREEMRAFEIDKVISRKTIERLLEQFGGTSKG